MNIFRKISILLFCASLSHFLQAQESIGVRANDSLLPIYKDYFPAPFIPSGELIMAAKSYPADIQAVRPPVDLSDIKFNIDHLATFCRLELKLEKATKFPVKFRLGEVQYVEQMEGK